MSYDTNPFKIVTSEASSNNIQNLPIYNQPIKRETIYEEVKVNKPIVMNTNYNNINTVTQQYDFQNYDSNNYGTTVYNQNGDLVGNNNYDNLVYGQTTNLDNNNNYYTQTATYTGSNNYNYGSNYNNLIYDTNATTTVSNSNGYNNYIYDANTTTTVNDVNNYNNLVYDTNATAQVNGTTNYDALYYDKGANIVTNNYNNGFYNQTATTTITEINGTYNPSFIASVEEDNNLSSYPVPTLQTHEYSNNYNYLEQQKISNGTHNIVYSPLERVTNEKILSNSNVTFGKVPSQEIDTNQIDQKIVESKTNLNSKGKQIPIISEEQPVSKVQKAKNIAIVRKIVDNESNVNNTNNINPNMNTNIQKINPNYNNLVKEPKMPLVNNIQTAPKVVGRPNTNKVIIESNVPKSRNAYKDSYTPIVTNIKKVINVGNNPNININQVSDDRQVNPIYRTMNLTESKLNMNNLNDNNNSYKEDIGNNTVNIIDLRKGFENKMIAINPRYNIKTINNTLNDLKIKNGIEMKNTRRSKSPVNEHRSISKSPIPSSKGFHKVRIVKKSPGRNRGNINFGMNYNSNYNYLTYNCQNKNSKINPYPNINAISFNNDKKERKNSNSFAKVKNVDRKINSNVNAKEFSSSNYNTKSNYNRNYENKYENDFNDQNKINDNNNFNNISEIKHEMNNSTDNDNEEIGREENNLNFKKQYMPLEYPTFDDDSNSDKKNKYNCTVKKLDSNINDNKNENSYHHNGNHVEQKEEKENNSKSNNEFNVINNSDNEKNDKKSEKNEINDSKIKRMKNNDGLDEFDNNFNNHDKFYNKMKNLFDD